MIIPSMASRLAVGLLSIAGYVHAGSASLNSFDNSPSNTDFSDDFYLGSLPASSELWTPKHKTGTCALRGRCGKSGFFGPELPCVDNRPAAEIGSDLGLSTDGQERLIGLCGEEWRDVIESRGSCCDDGQLDSLASNLKRADQIIGSCPACRKNFFSVFCSFTCSPDQSVFVNVTTAAVMKGETTAAVQALTVGLTESFGKEFYDSCKDVQFGSGMPAMSLIGGGAKNHRDMLAFIGKKRLGGSPFEMVFVETAESPMELLDIKPKRCDDDDEAFRCACSDCKAVCPTLPRIKSSRCRVGVLPCLTFAVLLVYSIVVFSVLLAAAYVGHKKRPRTGPLFVASHDDLDDGASEYLLGGGRLPSRWGQIKSMFERFNSGIKSGCYGCFNCFDSFFQFAFDRLHTVLRNFCARIGMFSADFPFLTIGVGIALALLCSAGWFRAHLEIDPVKLWVAPESEAALQRQYFVDKMGPQIRAEQIIAVNASGPVLSRETLEWWIQVEDRVDRLRAELSDGSSVGWDDVCLNPAGACTVQSVGGYFRDRNLDGWEDRVRDCAAVPVDCLADGLVVDPDLVLGRAQSGGKDDVLDSNAIILTWIVDGAKDQDAITAWENVLHPVLRSVEAEATDRGLVLSFSTGQSLEHELGRTAGSDARVVVASYLVMLVYVVVMLSWRSAPTDSAALALVYTKVGVGVAGIGIVILSVAAAGGIVAILGLSVTLIIAEVIPFLVLAVGVDNVFLLVHAVEKVHANNLDMDAPGCISRALTRRGPSIILASSAEIGLFGLGAFVGMPAVRNFAIYAAIAVFVNALLQLTVFVAILSLDLRRIKSRRIDCVPCFSVDVAVALPPDATESWGTWFFRDLYAPAVIRARYLIVIIGVTLFAVCIGVFFPRIELGLDQRLALPADSHLVTYFDHMAAYFKVGPPVFFVVDGVDVSARPGQSALCGRVAGCRDESVPTILALEAERSCQSLITGGVAGWEDDFFRWLDPAVGCCLNADGSDCWPDYDRQLSGMPTGDELVRLVKIWLDVVPLDGCPLGGAPYRDVLVFSNSTSPEITASNFRTSHTPLRTQSDFINAYTSARRIASDLSSAIDAPVFAYSEFYVFFHQYLTIIPLARNLLLSAAGVVFCLVSAVTGSFQIGAIVTAVVSSIVVHVIAAMAILGIALNAVTVVNILICAGLAVEFCAHVGRAYAVPDGAVLDKIILPRSSSSSSSSSQMVQNQLAMAALVDVGPAIVEGIGLTKIIGVAVLAFAPSKIFDLYYFRVWAVLVAVSLVHALVILPALLAVAGPVSPIRRVESPSGQDEFQARIDGDEDCD